MEILIIAAISAIILSIVIPAARKPAAPKPLRDKSDIVNSYGKTGGGAGEAGGTIALLGLGFGLGVGATLCYQRWHKQQCAPAPEDSEEEKPRVVH